MNHLSRIFVFFLFQRAKDKLVYNLITEGNLGMVTMNRRLCANDFIPFYQAFL